jgi:hypothetical protein
MPTTVASSNGSDITCEFTTFHISNLHIKSLYSGRTRASISGPLSAAYLRSTTCHGKLKYPPTTFCTSAVFCPRVNPSDTPFGAPHHRPFEYILAISRSRRRPRWETVLWVSSESESELESEFDSEDLVENSDTDTSVFNPGASRTTRA